MDRHVTGALAALLLLPGVVFASPPPASQAVADSIPSGRDVMERMTQAAYYPGHDMVADVRMEIVERSGLTRLRVMTMMRLNLPGGDQRYLVYFHKPGDVRRMSCMVYKHVGRADDRWIYLPAAGQIRRITAPERSRFLGSDFVREDYSGRDAAADSHRVVRAEIRDGRSCWVVESTPLRDAEFARMTTWVDRKSWLPVRQEYYDARGALMRTFTADKVRDVADAAGVRHPTIVEKTMAGRMPPIRTEWRSTDVHYDVGLKEGDFSDEHLKMPMESWYRGKR